MNGKNKRWLEQRWDKMQPARLAHIHKAHKRKEEKALPEVIVFFGRGYCPDGRIKEHWFEGKDLIETNARATRWADENAHRYTRVEVLNSTRKTVYSR